MSLPPVPGLIPISSFNLKNARRRDSNLRASDEEVMGEQRSRRINSEASDDLIDSAAPSSKAPPPPPPPPRSGRAAARRKSQRKQHKRASDRDKVDDAAPRVNPIFVWVRQENNKIVDVKCEDYDKRNRIVLTKTAQGWRAMPRTETLAAAIREDDRARKAKKSHHHRHHKVKRKSTGVQADSCDSPAQEIREEIDLVTPPPPPSPPPSPPPPSLSIDMKNEPQQLEAAAQNKCEVTSPLDNLLAVAELEFNQQIQEECEKSKAQDNTQNEDCDYTEEDDTVMNQILMELEQSLQSPEALCVKPSEPDEVIEEQDAEEDDEYIDDEPTDLSMPKAIASPRPVSRCSSLIQSPQPSGLPPVPPSPDVHKTESKLPECEESISSSLPDKKPKGEEDATLRAMLSKDTEKKSNSKASSEPSRLLELLMSPEVDSPLTQLKHLLTDPNISMPDPLLIPKNRLSAILTAPGKEIPRLLWQRPELRLSEALKHADLLKNPDILVITVHQLKTILQKQSSLPDESSAPKPQEKPIEAHSLFSLLNSTALMTWLPRLQQIEVAMSFGHQDFLKMLKNNPNEAGAFPLPFSLPPPHQFVPQVPTGYQHFYPHQSQFEYPIYTQLTQPPPLKNHCCATEKPRPGPAKFAPYANSQHMRSNLQVPQYNPTHHRSQKNPKSKASSRDKSAVRDKCGESALRTHLQHHPHQQPMDLSSVNNVMLKRSKYNQNNVNYCDPPVGAKASARFDDTVPEVGSTTASIEDFAGLGIPEAPTNVWHPLFTSPKVSANPNSWNWPTSVTATGE